MAYPPDVRTSVIAEVPSLAARLLPATALLLVTAACNGPTPPADADHFNLDTVLADATQDMSAADGAIDTSLPPDAPAMPIAYPMPPVANAVGQTDPRWNGQYRFLYDAWGTEVLGEWPPAAFVLSLMTSEPAVFGNHLSNFGFIPDPNDPDGLPFGFTRGLHDPTQIHETCALCHTAHMPDGTIRFGAPNVALDFGGFRVAVNQRWTAAGNPALISSYEQTKAARLGPGRFQAESDDYALFVPADLPVYFTLAQRSALNYMGTGADVRSEAFMAIYSFGAGSPTPATAQVPFPSNATLMPFLAFLGTLDPPQAPAQDPTMVAAGQAVFHQAQCDSCHHPGAIGMDGVVTLSNAPGAPELVPGQDPTFPRGTIATDPSQFTLQAGTAGSDAGVSDAGVDQGLADLVTFILHEGVHERMTDGYRVNDLRALWFTAPYLHNGTVPTLADLLSPASQRPVTFMRGTFTVDTTLQGNSNAGHEFGTTLSTTDKAALIAYLNSL